MRNYILRRLLILIPIMLGVSFLTFAMFRMIPGDAAVLRCQLGCTPEVLEDLRHEMGLDRPWYQQYGDWVWNIVRHGDLGQSLTESRLPVTTGLDRRLLAGDTGHRLRREMVRLDAATVRPRLRPLHGRPLGKHAAVLLPCARPG